MKGWQFLFDFRNSVVVVVVVVSGYFFVLFLSFLLFSFEVFMFCLTYSCLFFFVLCLKRLEGHLLSLLKLFLILIVVCSTMSWFSWSYG